MIEHEFVRAWGWLFALVFNGLVLWVSWSLSRKFVTREDFAVHIKSDESHKTAVRDHLAEHDATLITLADKVNAMPGKDAIHVLDVKLANIQGEQARVNEALNGLREILRRIESQTELLYRDRLEDK